MRYLTGIHLSRRALLRGAGVGRGDRFGELGAQPAEPVGAHELEHGRAVGIRVRLRARGLRASTFRTAAS